jgi:hypothetical protein
MSAYQTTVAGRVLSAISTQSVPLEADVDLLRGWVDAIDRWRDPDDLACLVIQADVRARREPGIWKAQSA